MNKHLERIYIPIAEDSENNLFRTSEIDEKYDDFFNTYFSTSVMTHQEYDTACEKIVALMHSIEGNAFEVGFYTAVQLLTNSK